MNMNMNTIYPFIWCYPYVILRLLKVVSDILLESHPTVPCSVFTQIIKTSNGCPFASSAQGKLLGGPFETMYLQYHMIPYLYMFTFQ